MLNMSIRAMYVFYAIIMLSLFVTWEIARYFLHLSLRSRLKLVINVNGTRGKSSVVRLLCFALKEAGYKVMAKTTGTVPQLITVGDQVVDIKRGAYPNINEQMKVVKEAAVTGAEVLVAECMAIDPGYQKITESKMLRSDLGIITNVRNDHRESMGGSLQQIANALSNTIPRGKTVFTAERTYFDIIKKNADKNKADAVQCRDTSAITDEMMLPFPFLETRENVALVLDVCKHLGVEEAVALRGMYNTTPDPGVLRTKSFLHEGKWFEFVNAFAANDPDSTAMIWTRMSRKFRQGQKKIFLFNARRDRPIRSVDIARSFARFPVDVYIATGTGWRLFKRMLLKSGVHPSKIVCMGMKHAEATFNKCTELANNHNFVFCAGNIKGRGEEFFDLVSTMSEKANERKVQ